MLESKNKLIPLRRFALIDCYSKEYLSQLVQRKRLKAKKIGHNYFTTLEWFEEYLQFYARDDKSREIKRQLYQVLELAVAETENNNIKQDQNKSLTQQDEVSFLLPETIEHKKTILNKISIIKYILASTLVVIIFLFLLSVYFNNRFDINENGTFGTLRAGHVAGVSETNPTVINKGELQDGYMMYNNSLYRVSDTVSTSAKKAYMIEEVK